MVSDVLSPGRQNCLFTGKRISIKTVFYIDRWSRSDMQSSFSRSHYLERLICNTENGWEIEQREI